MFSSNNCAHKNLKKVWLPSSWVFCFWLLFPHYLLKLNHTQRYYLEWGITIYPTYLLCIEPLIQPLLLCGPLPWPVWVIDMPLYLTTKPAHWPVIPQSFHQPCMSLATTSHSPDKLNNNLFQWITPLHLKPLIHHPEDHSYPL